MKIIPELRVGNNNPYIRGKGDDDMDEVSRKSGDQHPVDPDDRSRKSRSFRDTDGRSRKSNSSRDPDNGEFIAQLVTSLSKPENLEMLNNLSNFLSRKLNRVNITDPEAFSDALANANNTTLKIVARKLAQASNELGFQDLTPDDIYNALRKLNNKKNLADFRSMQREASRELMKTLSSPQAA